MLLASRFDDMLITVRVTFPVRRLNYRSVHFGVCCWRRQIRYVRVHSVARGMPVCAGFCMRGKEASY
jgi:hypothetical protein